MRRKDKLVQDRKEIDGIIGGSRVIRVAMAMDGQPYLVPLNFGYDGTAIYVHTADRGLKIDHFEANPKVCFECERDVIIVEHRHKACDWGAQFESVIGFGTIEEVLDKEDKRSGLNCIMGHYSGRDWDLEDARVKRTRVWRIRIDSMTGKRSG